MMETYTYDASSRQAFLTVILASSAHKFTGKERDSESGLDNFGARYDSSQYGRFMTPDPGNAGADPTNPQSWNMYSYVLNNPLSYIDPTGMDCVYLNDDESAGTVLRGDCQSSTDNGIYVNGTVNTSAGAWLNSNGSFSFAYTPDGGTQQQYLGDTPSPGLPASADLEPLGLNVGSNTQSQSSAQPNSANSLVPSNPCSYTGRALTASDYATAGKASNGNSTNLALDAFKGFPRGDYLDAQPLASGNPQQRAAYGNYVFGVYMAAAGVPLSRALAGGNAYAFLSGAKYGSSNGPMDPNHGSLPAANVANITNGYNAQAGGSTCHN